MEQEIVKKDNNLANAHYALSEIEQRLLLSATINSSKAINAKDPIVVTAADYAKHHEISLDKAYSTIYTASKRLFRRSLKFKTVNSEGLDEFVECRWLSKVTRIPDSGMVSIRLTDEVLPLITEVKKRFTYYDIKNISGLTSNYAMRLYEMLISWRGALKTPEIAVADLRGRLGVEEGDYQRMSNFKARVVDFSIKQINERTDITVSYVQHKRGRVITGFSFTFEFKEAEKPALPNKSVSKSKPKTPGETGKKKYLTKDQAGKKAKTGESWEQLTARLMAQGYVIKFKEKKGQHND